MEDLGRDHLRMMDKKPDSYLGGKHSSGRSNKSKGPVVDRSLLLRNYSMLFPFCGIP